MQVRLLSGHRAGESIEVPDGAAGFVLAVLNPDGTFRRHDRYELTSDGAAYRQSYMSNSPRNRPPADLPVLEG